MTTVASSSTNYMSIWNTLEGRMAMMRTWGRIRRKNTIESILNKIR
jgi:hypothetical protein